MSGRLMIITVFALISACATVSFSYLTIALSSDFISNSTRIEAKAPIRRYRQSFFNLELGDFQVEDVDIGDLSKSKGSSKTEKKFSEKTLCGIFWSTKKIEFESVTFEQYRYEESKDFLFNLTSMDQKVVKTNCTITTLGLEKMRFRVHQSVFLEATQTINL